MIEVTKKRTAELQRRLKDGAIDLALLTDPDSIAYFAGFWGYLGVEFGRPTLLLVPADGACTVITPLMESEMVTAMTWIEDLRPWEDGDRNPWHKVLSEALGQAAGLSLGIETLKTPPLVDSFLRQAYGKAAFRDVTKIIGEMRMIKAPEEIEIMRQAGAVAIAMVEAGKAAMGLGVPEYEVALAVIAGGTRKAAGFLTDRGWESFISPTVHNLQILQSGHDTSMVHRRSSVRRLEAGDPIYLCCCGMVNFKQYKLGFDREFFIASVNDEQAKAYEVTIAAQKAALDSIRPGVLAEDVHFAAEEVYRAAGHTPGYRTGRAIGCSFLEMPELKAGDKTPLAAGMTFAVDGGVTLPGVFGGRIGDSILVTSEGYEELTPYPRELTVIDG